MRKPKRPITAIELIVIIAIMLCLSTIIGLGYVVAHFIAKFW